MKLTETEYCTAIVPRKIPTAFVYPVKKISIILNFYYNQNLIS